MPFEIADSTTCTNNASLGSKLCRLPQPITTHGGHIWASMGRSGLSCSCSLQEETHHIHSHSHRRPAPVSAARDHPHNATWNEPHRCRPQYCSYHHRLPVRCTGHAYALVLQVRYIQTVLSFVNTYNWKSGWCSRARPVPDT